MSAIDTANIGDTISESDWFAVDQARINRFADATDDHQWIHVDAERAANGPLGTCIAHGFMTLALVDEHVRRLALDSEGWSVAAYDRVRFLMPVPVNANLRIISTLTSRERTDMMICAIAEIMDAAKPACVADFRLRRG